MFAPTSGRPAAKPIYAPRSDRPTRSGPGRQAITFTQDRSERPHPPPAEETPSRSDPQETPPPLSSRETSTSATDTPHNPSQSIPAPEVPRDAGTRCRAPKARPPHSPRTPQPPPPRPPLPHPPKEPPPPRTISPSSPRPALRSFHLSGSSGSLTGSIQIPYRLKPDHPEQSAKRTIERSASLIGVILSERSESKDLRFSATDQFESHKPTESRMLKS